jgi:hypothetical protein
MSSAVPITAHLLDDTWADVMEEYKASLVGMPRFSAAVHPLIDSENLLSAIELMEPRTDPVNDWAKVKSVTDLLALGEIAKPSAMTDEQLLIDFTDGLTSLEARGLQGSSLQNSIGTCVYYYILDKVEKDNPTLYAYVLATVKCLDLVLTIAHSVSIREDDEFMPYPSGFCMPVQSTAAAIATLLRNAMKDMKSEALRSRFEFRLHWLSALENIMNPVDEKGIGLACASATAALSALAKCSRSAELTEPDRRWFRTESTYWLPSHAPPTPTPWLSHEATRKLLSETLEQLSTIERLLERRAIYAALDFLEELGMQRPLLVVRSSALLTATCDPNSILLSANISNRVLETLSRQCGAPLYEKIADEDKQSLDDVVGYRLHLHGAKAGSVSQQEIQSLRRHVVDSVRKWAAQVGRSFTAFAETLLSNRGRCQRRLANLVGDLSGLLQASWETDAATFCATMPGNNGPLDLPERELVVRSMVLSSFVSDMLLHAMTSFVQLSMELGLLTKPEMLPSAWYLLYLCGLRLENTTSLYITSPQLIPPRKTLRKSGPPVNNPAITSRTIVVPPSQYMLRIETTRMLADGFLVFGAIADADGLLSLKLPSTSLTSAENIFNHRYISFAAVQRPEFFTYTNCLKQISAFLQAKEKASGGHVLSLAATHARQMADHLRNHIATDPSGMQQRFFAAAEKTAKSMYTTMALYEAISKKEDKAAAFAQFSVQIECPYHPSMATVTVKPKPKK